MIRKKKTKIFFKIASIGLMVPLIATPLTACSGYLTFESSIQLIVSDNGSTLADQSFSESTYNGIREYFNSIKSTNSEVKGDLPNASDKSVKENNGLWKKPGVDTTSRIAAYRYAFEDGAKIAVATGYNQQDGLQQITSQKSEYSLYKNSFKNSAFVFVDGVMNSGGGDSDTYNSDPYNVASISYRADDGSFLAGISTAVFLNEYQEYFKQNGSLGVSSFVGLPLASTLNFFSGFRLGIHYWNKVLQPLIKTVDKSKPTLPIKWIDPVGGSSMKMSSFTSTSFNANEQKVSSIVTGMRKNGANAIFPIAGPQTALVVNQIVSDSSTKTIVVGVDTAQENTASLVAPLPNGGGIGTGNIVQFSSVKNLKATTEGVLEAITNGYNGKDANNGNGDRKETTVQVEEDSSGSTKNPSSYKGFYGLGWNNVGTLSNAGVGVSDGGLKYLINPNFTSWLKTSNGFATENNTTMTMEDITLDWLLQNQVAKELKASDPVIAEYNKLLNGTFKTKKDSAVTNQTENYDSSFTKIQETDGKNGPLDNGEWKIFNNSGDLNNYISIDLSKLVPGIKNSDGSDVTYLVPSSEAAYVGISMDDSVKAFYDSLTTSSMFYRKN